MPRSKRWPYFSGINVPLIVRILKNETSSIFRLQGGWKIRPRVGLSTSPPPFEYRGQKTPNSRTGLHLWENTKQSSGIRLWISGSNDERYDMVRSVVGKGIHLHPQLYAPQTLWSACFLHVPDSHNTGLEKNVR